MFNLRRLLQCLIGAAVCLAAFLVYHSLRRYSWAEVQTSVLDISGWRLMSAFLFVILSYVCLSLFDTLAVRYAGRPLAYRRTALASFTSLSIGHTVGMAALSSGAVRYRFYTRWGLTPHQVAKVIVFCGVTVGLGLATLGGLALVLDLGTSIDLPGLDREGRMAVGTACLVVPSAYLLFCASVRRPLIIRTWRFELPGLRLALAQVAVGTVNFICVSAALRQLLAAFTDVGLLDVASAYVTANIGALISHVPGGLGVLEAVMLNLIGSASAIGALVAFRVLYFFVPLSLGVPLLLASEAYYRRRPAFAAEPDFSGDALRRAAE